MVAAVASGVEAALEMAPELEVAEALGEAGAAAATGGDSAEAATGDLT